MSEPAGTVQAKGMRYNLTVESISGVEGKCPTGMNESIRRF